MTLLRLLLVLSLLCLPATGWAAPASVAAAGADTSDTDGTTTAVNMPSGIVAGNLLLVWCAHDSSTLLTQSGGSDWTRLFAQANGTAVGGAIFAKLAAGGDTLTVAGAAQDTACGSARLIDHGVEIVSTDIDLATAATGTSSTPNPPSNDPGAPDEFLWLEFAFSDDDDNSATPCTSSWTLVNSTESAQSASSVMVDVCSLASNASVMDPGTMALAASEEWLTQTLAIPPVYKLTPFTTIGMLDRFNRANAGNLSASWTDQTIGEGCGLQLFSRTANVDADSSNCSAYWNVGQFGPNLVVKVTQGAAASTQIGLYARLQTPGSGAADGYRVLVDLLGLTAQVQRLDNGSHANLGSTMALSWADGTSLAFKLSTCTLQVWTKPLAGSWTFVGEREDCTYLSAGYVALFLRGTGGAGGLQGDNVAAATLPSSFPFGLDYYYHLLVR